MFGAQEHVEDDERRADGDGGVGHVESRPVIGAEPDFKEVGDGAVNDAVGGVCGGAAEELSEACGGHRAAAVHRSEEPGERANDKDGAGD